MIFLDSDVLLIDLRYHRDAKYADNAAFLAELRASGKKAVTSIFNVLEICGVLSFNLNQQQLLELYHYLPVHYRLEVYPNSSLEQYLPRITVRRVVQVMYKRASFGDALVMCAAMDIGSLITHYVGWNAGHFVQRLPVPVFTPMEALRAGILA